MSTLINEFYLVLASVNRKVIEIRDYACKLDLAYTINDPFESHSQEVGKLSILDDTVCAISKNGCYINVYKICVNETI